MFTPLRVALLLLFLGLALSAKAKFESIVVEMTREPAMPATLVMSGLSNGRVEVAIDIDAEGKLQEWLVLSASHRELIAPCVEALQVWKYTPARYEGLPVMAQLRLSIDISQRGSVVSRSIHDTMDDFINRLAGKRPDYRIYRAEELDRAPTVVASMAPRYSKDAEKEGVRGRVQVHFYIDEQGTVRMPAVPAESNPYLSTAALQAMRLWKFEPPTYGGRPVLVAAMQEFNFGE